MTSQDILQFLREHHSTLQSLGVQHIGLFGSFAKGTQRPDSDIDILVGLDEPSFYKMAYVQIVLEEHFGRSIDILRKGPHLRPKFLQSIESEVIYA
ncbi:MAG: nucleotidyltransferase family protein [Saprospiraceae bacterium]